MISAHKISGLALAVLFISLQNSALAAPAAKLWPRWSEHDATSSAIISHDAWDAWLGRFVSVAKDAGTRVAYARVNAPDRARLRDYIDSLGAIEISAHNRAEQRAYWINLYNALTIDIVLEHYPLESIRDISSGLFSSGPWRLKLVQVEGEALSLDDIEHRILRPIWRDPRIHYAVNCASLGCPDLQTGAFTAGNSESMLEQAARKFVNSARAARFDRGKLEVSSIYHWFEEDFGGNHSGVIAHLLSYANADLAAALAGVEEIDDHYYDWRLNAVE